LTNSIAGSEPATGVDVLRMDRKPGDGIPRNEMHLAGRLHLFHGIVPLGPGLIHLLSGGILYSILLVFVGGYEPDHLSRAGNDGRMQIDMTSVGQDEFIESDGEGFGSSGYLHPRSLD
jgi:hypothetical protein